MGFIKAAVALQLLLSSIAAALPAGLVGLERDSVTQSSTVYDAIIVGGGPSGLSALSGLARVRRNVLLIDSGDYRNDATRHMHDVIGFDGVTPAYFRWAARRQLGYYETVSLINGTVTKIDVAASNTTNSTGTSTTPGAAPFTIQATFPSGEKATVGARSIILATGLSDILPETPGIKQNWGKGIFWCPWCDGNEHADQPLGIFSNILESASLVQEISTLNSDIVAFVNGTDTPSARAATEQKFPNWERYLALRNVTVENRTIAGVVRLADGGNTEADPAAPTAPEHDLFRVDFTEGPSVLRAAFFASFPNHQHSSVGADMGVTLYGGRLAADGAKGLMTNIPNVYAIGDANADNVTNVPHALFSGKRSAVFLHVQLARQETAATLAANATSVDERGLGLDPRAVWEEMNGGKADILDAGEFKM
ncbi:putative thioredoxin reductase [Xylariaceae sp. AK1471]|nr:putative thioredoxin reductase [Xylariaceae sp. AK1471]